MKSPEEIEKLAIEHFNPLKWMDNKMFNEVMRQKDAFIKGYVQCQQDNNKDKELESLFGRPINEVYDIEKYENPIDAINDIASGKLKPRDNADKKYTEEDLKNAFLEDANSITFDEYLEYLKSLNKQDE